ncbi:MAG: hypothetical protein RLZZ562_404 [Planctomycetota bacterium]
MNVEAPAPAKRPFWKRPLRLAFTIFVLLAILVALAPYVAAKWIEKNAGEELTRQLGTPCRIDTVRFGWLSGGAIEGVEIGNAPGFEAARPALQLESARFDIDFGRLFAGEYSMSFEAHGLRVSVEQDENGKTNFDALFAQSGMDADLEVEPTAQTHKPSATRRDDTERGLPVEFRRLRLHFLIADCSFELRKQDTLIESLQGITAEIDKDPGNTTVRMRLAASAPAREQGARPSSLQFTAEADAATKLGNLSLRAERVDLAQRRPLLDALLPTGAITRFQGMIDGAIEARVDAADSRDEPAIRSSGELTIDDLALAGDLFSGFEVSARQCTLRPSGRTTRTVANAAQPSIDMALAASSLDLGMDARDVTIDRNGQRIDRFDAIKIAASKSQGSPKLRTLLELEGMASPGKSKSSLLCTAESDTTTKFTRGVLQIANVQIAEWRRFAGDAISAEDLSRADGTLSGRIDFEADFGSARRVDVNGDVAIEAPRLEGALLRGASVRAERFVFSPSIRLLAPDLDGKNRIDLGKTSLDLGFLRVQSLDAAAREQRGIRDGGALEFRGDLAAIGALGGPCAELQGTTGMASGVIALPKELFEGDAESALAVLRDVSKLRADAELTGLSRSYKGLDVLDARVTAKLENGTLTAQSAESTRVNAGPLQIALRADATKEAMPFELSLAWKGGAVAGEAAELLRYLVPLLAGATGKAADFRSVCDLDISLTGFAQRRGDENALQWLDRWSGTGSITLTNGRVVPAPALQPLLSLLGQPQELAIDRLSSTFALQQGAITHRAMKWISKGQDYGLSGKVRLDGSMELGMDLTSLLQQHKDGKAIAGFLGDAPLTASIAGTVDAPKLATPDLGKLLQQALQAAPRQLLEQRGQDLLQKGLDRLFGDKKKKQDAPDKKQ